MIIQTAKFVKGIRGTDDILYDGKPQIVFVGRSNVGKSSLINSLVGRKALARSSSSPGKTVNLDFFLINDSFYFVDLPGYGYARRSAQQIEDIKKTVHWYFTGSDVKQTLVVLILDVKVGVTDFDREMVKLCRDEKLPFVIIVNKIDNLKMGQLEKLLAPVIHESASASSIIPYSTRTGIGKELLLETIFRKV